MPGVLRPLAGEEEGDRPVARLGRGGRAAARDRASRGPRAASARSRAEQRPAVLERLRPCVQGVGDVRQVEAAGWRAGGRPGGRSAVSRAAALFAESSRSCRGREALATARSGGASSRTTWALVPPMPSELTPARRGAPSGRPGAQLGVDEERAAREVDPRVGRLEVEARRDLPVVQGEHRLDQAADPGRGVEVADVGLQRADGAEVPARSVPPRGTPASGRRSRSGRRAPCRCRGTRRRRRSRGSTPALS